ncbi:hypothetical protein PHMEG_0004562 [Phytophthora megakarya]|uniref:Uncharacterized protein n=1 Tax=Phytophthora megakarya TaxID=4795 RepID=A0A225WV78_9STRA|nr:hypothetical protein PHMEG_0004562 [Phytophthora megakarya]
MVNPKNLLVSYNKGGNNSKVGPKKRFYSSTRIQFFGFSFLMWHLKERLMLKQKLSYRMTFRNATSWYHLIVKASVLRADFLRQKGTTPVPRKEDIYDAMAGSYSFSAMDLLWGFFQVRLRESDTQKNAIQLRMVNLST